VGNYKDSKIQTLARKGNGNFAYLDGFPEAEKVLMTEFTQTLYAVADEVSMEVELNKDYIKEYRLIGFDNKIGPLKDSLAKIEGGEVGSGQSMMVVFEIEPTAYNLDAVKRNFSPGKIADLKIHYRIPGDNLNREHISSIPLLYHDFNSIDKSFQFSTAVIMFGSLLRSSPHTKNITWNDVLKLGAESSNDEYLFQKEFVNIVQQAKTIYTRKNKKKKDLLSIF
jgi:Ca-activated chloride channel homolog